MGKSADAEEKEPLVYGDVGGSLVVLPEWVAQAYADDVLAIKGLKTWGEARRFEAAYLDFPGLDVEDDYADPPWDEEGPSDITFRPSPLCTLTWSARRRWLLRFGTEATQFAVTTNWSTSKGQSHPDQAHNCHQD
jgi:hypothetical protein